ncbi:MAG: alanine racemase [Clostridia bacterium]|nr:alanine racemase [Clostridia bacterium]
MKLQDYRLYSSLADLPSLQKWAEIDLGALRANYRLLHHTLRSHSASARMIAVVKADAYGHGAPACVRALLLEGCDFFAVSCIEEAIAVRQICDEVGGDTEVLILGCTEPAMAATLSRHRLIQTIFSPCYAEKLAQSAEEAGVRLCVHIAVDTGMCRIGFPAHTEEEIAISANAILCAGKRRGLEIAGMYTHFARADEADAIGADFTGLQVGRYLELRARLEASGMRIPFHHVSNSAAFIAGRAPLLDGVRIGILLYGAQPALQNGLFLTPVMRLRASIVHTYPLLPGECVGYGGEFSSDTERKIAVLPIGYADGFLRAYSGAEVTVHTKTGSFCAPIVGRICMDQCMIDITDTDAEVGDMVTLFGDADSPAGMLAQRVGSIDYETLCLVSARVKRVIC